MGNPTLSIIIPVYKVQDYLTRCLDSIVAQTFTDYECIMVDDGSPDQCGAICDEYAAKDSRFVVIHQENGGMSVARNNALKLAQGKYVAFIDGDDYILPTYCETMMGLLQSNHADIVKCDYFKGELEESNVKPVITLQTGNEFTTQVITDQIGSQLWQYIYKAELWKDIVSPPGRYAQDMMILHQVTDRAKTVVITTEKLYFYFIDRSDSTSNSSNKKVKGAFDRAIAFKLRYEYAAAHSYEPCLTLLMKNVLNFYNNALTLKDPSQRQFDEDVKTLSAFLRNNKQDWAISKNGYKHFIIGLCLAYLPGLYSRLKRIPK